MLTLTNKPYNYTSNKPYVPARRDRMFGKSAKIT